MRPVLRDDDVVLIDGSGIAVDKPDPIANVLHEGNLLLELARMPYIVSIERSNVLPACMCCSPARAGGILWSAARPQVAGGCHSLVRLSPENDSWVSAANSLDYRCGVIAGPVVDNDDL
jgi:hypothetical protein